MTPVAAYLRRSTDKQELSLEQQRAEVERYCTDKRFRVVEWYEDSGISGADIDNRPGFQRMLADCRSGLFQAVIYWDVSRLLRTDMITGGYVAHLLRSAGVVVHSVQHGLVDWNNLAGRLVWGVEVEAKQSFLRQLSGDVIRAQLQAAMRGEWVSGKTPQGYVVRDKKLALGSRKDVNLVRRLFRDYLAGHSLRSLAGNLNSEGVSSPSGGQWSATAILEKLTNVAYVGTYRWNFRSAGKFHSISNGRGVEKPFSNGRKKNDESDWIVIENNHPAIIDTETFQKVQHRLAQQRKRTTPYRNGGRFVFTGLAFCGSCGSPMHGRISGDGKSYYRCSRAENYRTCPGNVFDQDVVFNRMVDEFRDQFLNADFERRMTALIVEMLRESHQPSREPEIQRQLSAAQRKLAKAKARLLEVDRDMLSVVQEHIRSCQSECDRLERELSAARVPASVIAKEQTDRIRNAVGVVRRLVENAGKMTVAEKREELSKVLERIVVKTSVRVVGRRRFYNVAEIEVSVREDLSGSAGRSLQVFCVPA